MLSGGFFDYSLLYRNSPLGQSLKLAKRYDYYIEYVPTTPTLVLGVYKRINRHFLLLAEEAPNDLVQYIVIPSYIIRIANFKRRHFNFIMGTIFDTSRYNIDFMPYQTVRGDTVMSVYRQLVEIKDKWIK